jgi:hypothetical protein
MQRSYAPGSAWFFLFLLRGSRVANSTNSIELSALCGRIGKTVNHAGPFPFRAGKNCLHFSCQIGKNRSAAFPKSQAFRPEAPVAIAATNS